MAENEKKKVRIRLERHLWPDEIQQRKRKKQVTALMIASLVLVFAVGFLLGGSLQPQALQSSLSQNESFAQAKLNSIYSIMKNEWYFGKEDENLEQDLIDAALYGMSSSSLDPHTTYMSAEETLAFSTSIDNNFVGIGIQYYSGTGLKVVTRVFVDSPAYEAGLQAGDILVAADGTALADLSSDEVAALVKGEAGTQVQLEVLRNNEPLTLTITRREVNTTVFGEMIDEAIGYLQIMSFGSTTGEECGRYLDLMSEQGLQQLVIDLRDNGGGYLDALVSVANLFLPADTLIMTQEYKDGQTVQTLTTGGNRENIQQIVILINQDTASASEVLAMALKEQRDDVTLVGTTSYGKGSVQVQRPFADGSVLKYTNSRWLTPKGEWINGVGIEPDVTETLPEVFQCTLVSFVMEEEESYQQDQVSEHVASAQKALNFLGYATERTDGYFDDSTQSALSRYQSENNLTADGVLDGATLQSLYSSVQYAWSTDKSLDNQLQRAVTILHEQ